MSFFATLKERRLPQFVAAYAATGWVALQIVDQLVDRAMLPDQAYPTVLAIVIIGAPAAIILSWFHGAPGGQKFRPVEISLLAVLGVLAIGASIRVWQATSDADGGPLQRLERQTAPVNAGLQIERVAILEGPRRAGGCPPRPAQRHGAGGGLPRTAMVARSKRCT